MRDPESGEHRGFGFVAYDAFESSDAALAAMNGQFLCDRPIHVSYAYKKETKGNVINMTLFVYSISLSFDKGERHGSAAERMLAGNRQTLLKDQQQQQVMANVMSTMMSSIVGQPTPLGATPSATIPGRIPMVFHPFCEYSNTCADPFFYVNNPMLVLSHHLYECPSLRCYVYVFLLLLCLVAPPPPLFPPPVSATGANLTPMRTPTGES